MKKYIFVALVLFALTFSLVALAEGEEAMGNPFTWEYLATTAGVSAFVLLVVQFIKAPLDKVFKIPTRLLAWLIAVAATLLATNFTVGLTLENAILSVVNAFVSSAAAYGTYELTFSKLDHKDD